MAVIIKKGTRGGIRINENKKSAESPISIMNVVPRVIIPLQQHAGAECEPVVKKGDYVKEGDLIGKSPVDFSANIHSSISGSVSAILKIINPVTSTIISAVEVSAPENTKGNIKKTSISTGDALKAIASIDKFNAPDMLEFIKQAGVVGLGGAAFPAHLKLSPPPGKKIDTLIINGCECEPYITADHRLMLEYAAEIICGAYITARILKVDNIIIAIENNKQDAISNIESVISSIRLNEKIKIVSLPSRYPMGAEKVLIYNLLRRKVPVGALPFDVGTVVSNVGTSRAIFDAVIEKKPLIERVITVTGDIEKPANLMVKTGTLVGDIIGDIAGIICEDKNISYELVFGGPMTGFSINNLDFPVTKSVNCILIKKVKKLHENNCIRCGRCISVCPMNLMPLMYATYVKNNRFEDCRQYFIESCIECGSCAYVCPAAIPLIGYIKTGKSVLSRK